MLISDYLQQLQHFAEQGGPVIWVLLLLCCVMWTLIFERLWFYRVSSKACAQVLSAAWLARQDRYSWKAHRVRDSLIAELSLKLYSLLSVIKTLVLLCPLLGLLGTVTGMVAVFDVIALNGTSDAQGLARGVFRATLPTMAGLVVSITGLYMTALLQRLARDALDHFSDSLPIGDSSLIGGMHGRA